MAESFCKGDKDMAKYLVSHSFKAVRMDDGRICDVRNVPLETAFCFGYGYYGNDLDRQRDEALEQEKEAHTQGAFLRNNLKEIREFFTTINHPDGELFLVNGTDEGNMYDLPMASTERIMKGVYREGNYRKASDRERAEIMKAYKELAKAQASKCRKHWEKFGDSKLRTWVYWAD